MLLRIYIVFLLLYAGGSFADSGAWNCEKAAGEEWACSAEGPKQQPVMTPTDAQNQEPLPARPQPVKAVKPIPLTRPPQIVAQQRQGWNCKNGDQTDVWNCSLFGADPKGEARIMEEDQTSFTLLSPAFDYKQEQVFATLHSQLKYDPWENCAGAYRAPPDLDAGKSLRDFAPMDVRADYSEVFDKEITSFYGNVVIRRADQKVMSDMASYDTVSETMDAQGHVFYDENELSLYSDTALLNLGSDEARLRDALFISPGATIRGSSDVVYRDSKFLSRYQDAAFTSCRPGNQDWVMHAERLKMNKQTGQASAKHAWLEIKGLPVFYTPYVSFPLDDRRLSGFLAPTWGSTDDNGFSLIVPYYWNIAPNYDLTLRPRYLSKRGGMLGADFRYLTEMTQGTLGGEYLPYDQLDKKQRFALKFENQTQFTPNLNANADVKYVSDIEYIDELKNTLGLAHDRYLKSQANFNYQTYGVNLLTHFEGFQTIDKQITSEEEPYYKLPQVALNLNHSLADWPLDLAMDNEYVNFFRDSKVSGHRMNLKPSVTLPFESAMGFIRPKASLQYTQYELYNHNPGDQDSISRALPIMSVDSGLFFEKDFNLAGSDYMHTLEPRLFYLYIPYEDQSDIPNFDSSLYDFNYSSLFRENRFSGSDRVQDANQLTYALTTRLVDHDSGQERLNLSIGQIFYLEDRNVVLPGQAPETHSFSNLVGELNGQLTDHLSFRSGLQWNPDYNDVTRAEVMFRYRDQPNRIFNIGYRYRHDDPLQDSTIIQGDSSFRWPIYDHWYGVGRWLYSFKYDSTKESFLGLEKESCCWRFRILWRRYTNALSDDGNGEMNQGIFLQLELKGLTSFGDNVEDFLEKNIMGYQRPE
jgi:LPS-assembly protein